jgi:hypothetical protein
MSSVKLKENEERDNEPRIVDNRKQYDGSSRLADTITSKGSFGKMESETKMAKLGTPAVDFNLDDK